MICVCVCVCMYMYRLKIGPKISISLLKKMNVHYLTLVRSWLNTVSASYHLSLLPPPPPPPPPPTNSSSISSGLAVESVHGACSQFSLPRRHHPCHGETPPRDYKIKLSSLVEGNMHVYVLYLLKSVDFFMPSGS